MTVAHILGFPRIGAKRELKLALEAYWRGEISEPELSNVGRELRKRHWQRQRDAGLDFVTVGDFAWYDSVLQTLAHLGCVPGRFGFDPRALTLPQYFTLARGDADHPAMEMTKWFDTNYHYLVPEWNADTRFEGGVDWLFREVKEAKEQGHAVKVALLGPLTLLHIGKIKAGPSHKLDLLPRLVPAYQRLLAHIKDLGVQWVQIDEPILGLDLEERWLAAFRPTYEALAPSSPKILLATYFEPVAEHAAMLKSLPVAGIHLDLVRGPQQLATFLSGYPESKVLSLGVVDGRNIWRTDLDKALAGLNPAHDRLGECLWISASCSLLHVPVDLDHEKALAPEIRGWLAFAVQKLDEIAALKQGVEGDPKAIMPALMASREAAASRRRSERVLSDAVRRRLEAPAAAHHVVLLVSANPRDTKSARGVQEGGARARGVRRGDARGNPPGRGASGGAGAGRAGARRSRAQRHGRVFRRVASGLRLHRERLGAELRLAVREAAGHLRRRLQARSDDGGVDAVCPESDGKTDERHADRPDHHAAMVVRARRPAAQ